MHDGPMNGTQESVLAPKREMKVLALKRTE